MTCGIYSIKNLNGSVYIGSSTNIERRWKEHQQTLRHGTHVNNHLQRAWVRDGADAFSFDVLIIVPKEDLITMEQYALDSIPMHLRYNATICIFPSRLGMKLSQASKEKIGRSVTQKMSAERRDPELWAKRIRGLEMGRVKGPREGRSIAMKRRWEDPQYRQKISTNSKAMWGSPEWQKWLSEKRKAQWAEPAYRAKMLAANSLSLSRIDDSLRKRRTAKMAEFHRRPEVRSRKSAMMKAYWAKRKAAGLLPIRPAAIS